MITIISTDNQKARDVDQTPETLIVFNELLEYIYSGEIKMLVFKDGKLFSGMKNGQSIWKKTKIKC